MRLIHESYQTKIVLQGTHVTKLYQGDYAKDRFEKELAFYKVFHSRNLPHFISETSRPEFSITTSLLKGESPGFLDQTNSGFLTHKDLLRVQEALFNIQNLPKNGLLVHGDLAPHNVYLTESRVVIADWDSYWFVSDSRYRMYDYAFLWSMFDFNEDHLIKVFEEDELPNLKMKGLLNDFSFCFKKRIADIEKYSEKLQSGKKLKDVILNLIQNR